jgi:hypothetical protein
MGQKSQGQIDCGLHNAKLAHDLLPVCKKVSLFLCKIQIWWLALGSSFSLSLSHTELLGGDRQAPASYETKIQII